MYRTEIDGHYIVIRFSQSSQSFESSIQREAIKSILQLENKILLYKKQCIATMVESVGYVISYIQEGDVIDVQIQNIVPFPNVLIS